jgi:REP-associated tyrosine transposase
MSRPLRIEIANGLYHVMSRGLERRRIVRDGGDCARWVDLLGRVAERRRWRVYAFVLMTNHFHLLFRTPEADLSAGMHDLNAAYVTGFNRRHRRNGPLYQGRYKALLVDDEYHYWELGRYIDLNPVRARMVDDPAKYAWGSHRWYGGARGCPTWLARDEMLAQFGGTERTARRNYRKFVLAGVESPPISPLRKASPAGLLGSTRFIRAMQKRLEGLLPDREVPAARALKRVVPVAEIAAATATAFGVSVESLRERGRHGNAARKAAIYMTRQKTGLGLREIGSWYGGLRESSTSNIIRTLAAALPKQRTLRRRIAQIEKCLETQGDI